uniref:Uncharacterized protein n=1 Tax=Gadus morhua TaxID=8049 RepID=A0A8C5C1N8_GADMO
MSVLHAATHTGHHTLVVWLATFTDLSLCCQDREGATALHFAASRGHRRLLETLLHLGSKVTRDYWGGTPLHDAAENGELECCKVLLAGLADSSEQDIDGFTAADLAEYNGHYDCARYLRNVQANVRPPHGQSSVLCLTCHPSSGRPLIYPSSRVVFSKGPLEGQKDPRPFPVEHSSYTLGSGLVDSHVWYCCRTPSTSSAPSTLSTPSTPSTSSTSSTPNASSTSSTPSTPSTSSTPSTLSTPSTPSTSSTPSTPSTPSHHDSPLPEQMVVLPTEEGRPIAEWKRQVMVRQLQARLLDEEDQRRRVSGGHTCLTHTCLHTCLTHPCLTHTGLHTPVCHTPVCHTPV